MILSDRLGLRQAIVIGTLLSTVSYAVLPLIGHTLALALAGIFLVFVSFEFSIVTTFSLSTEVTPAGSGGASGRSPLVVGRPHRHRSSGCNCQRPWPAGIHLGITRVAAGIAG